MDTFFTPHLFFYVNENLVSLRVRGLNDFSLDHDSIVNIMKIKFPEQYEYYLKYGSIPPPITAMEVIWRLTFQNGKLIRKEIDDYINETQVINY